MRRSEEVDRTRYDEIVKTLMADVDALHRDYLTSFRKYHDSLAGKKELDAAFLEKVATDSLFSRDLRARVRALVEAEADPRWQPLMRAVRSYLELAVVNPIESGTLRSPTPQGGTVGIGSDGKNRRTTTSTPFWNARWRIGTSSSL